MSVDPVSHVLSWIIIYLCSHTALDSFLYCYFPYQYLGFSLVGFTNVPLLSFLRTSSLWHFQDFNHIRGLRSRSAVRDSSLPSVIFSASTNTTSIAASVSMDFPLTNKFASNYPDRLLDFFRVMTKTPQILFIRSNASDVFVVVSVVIVNTFIIT